MFANTIDLFLLNYAPLFIIKKSNISLAKIINLFILGPLLVQNLIRPGHNSDPKSGLCRNSWHRSTLYPKRRVIELFGYLRLYKSLIIPIWLFQFGLQKITYNILVKSSSCIETKIPNRMLKLFLKSRQTVLPVLIDKLLYLQKWPTN